jgi:hypothetical protein
MLVLNQTITMVDDFVDNLLHVPAYVRHYCSLNCIWIRCGAHVFPCLGNLQRVLDDVSLRFHWYNCCRDALNRFLTC